MLVYRIDDMTCGHCVSIITKAVRAIDAGARIDIDVAQHLARIEPTEATAEELRDAITEAGYTPVEVQGGSAPAASPRAAGCCGGCGG